MLKIAVCVSGGGTNLQAVIDAIAAGKITNTQIVKVISNKAGAYALQGRAGLWVTHLDGNPSSVIGLSLSLVHSLLIRAGYPL